MANLSKTAYLNGKIKMAVECRAAAKLLFGVAAIIALLAIARCAWNIEGYSLPVSTLTVLYTLPLQGISLAFLSSLAIQSLRHNGRELQELQSRLAALEAEKQSGNDGKLNRGVMEEDSK